MDPELPASIHFSEECLMLISCTSQSRLPTNFILQTDASDRSIGALLSQRDDDGMDYPIAYFSKKLLLCEVRYSTVEKECLAINRVYLLGRPFIIQTEHRSLKWLDQLKDTNSRLTRWSLALQPYCYTVEYRSGASNGNADALS